MTELLPRWIRDVCNDEGQIVECFVVPAQSEFAKASASQLRGRFEQVVSGRAFCIEHCSFYVHFFTSEFRTNTTIVVLL